VSRNKIIILIHHYQELLKVMMLRKCKLDVSKAVQGIGFMKPSIFRLDADTTSCALESPKRKVNRQTMRVKSREMKYSDFIVSGFQ
jgi:hypothetical protein